VTRFQTCPTSNTKAASE